MLRNILTNIKENLTWYSNRNHLKHEINENSYDGYWKLYQNHPKRASFLFTPEQKCKMVMKANLDDGRERENFFKQVQDKKFISYLSNQPNGELGGFLKDKLTNHNNLIKDFFVKAPRLISFIYKADEISKLWLKAWDQSIPNKAWTKQLADVVNNKNYDDMLFDASLHIPKDLNLNHPIFAYSIKKRIADFSKREIMSNNLLEFINRVNGILGYRAPIAFQADDALQRQPIVREEERAQELQQAVLKKEERINVVEIVVPPVAPPPPPPPPPSKIANNNTQPTCTTTGNLAKELNENKLKSVKQESKLQLEEKVEDLTDEMKRILVPGASVRNVLSKARRKTPNEGKLESKPVPPLSSTSSLFGGDKKYDELIHKALDITPGDRKNAEDQQKLEEKNSKKISPLELMNAKINFVKTFITKLVNNAIQVRKDTYSTVDTNNSEELVKQAYQEYKTNLKKYVPSYYCAEYQTVAENIAKEVKIKDGQRLVVEDNLIRILSDKLRELKSKESNQSKNVIKSRPR